MGQLTLLPDVERKAIVNVASVPQRSPLRYPGGKTWLVPVFRDWISNLAFKPRLLVEPFCGGGIIGLTAAMEGLAEKALLCEIDPNVGAVWQTLVNGDYEALARRILAYPISRERVIDDLRKSPVDDLDAAFQTILRNRVQRGGILAPGASIMKNGENGRGVASRWYPDTLARRIREIGRYRNRLMFVQGDAFEVIPGRLREKRTVFFLDPPYTAGGKRAGNRLYQYKHVDHERLFDLMARAQGRAMITYDDNPKARELARKHGFRVEEIPMKNTHHAKMAELVITT